MVVLRGIVAATGVLTVAATYLAGRELFSRRAALFGASILTVSFLHVRNSHYATNDVLATFFLGLSFLFSARVYTRGRTGDYLLAGLFGGLGTATKYNVGFFCVAILAAHLMRDRRLGRHGGQWQRHLPLVASALASLAAFILATPYSVLDFQTFWYDFRTQSGFGADPWRGQATKASAILYLETLARGFGIIPLALAVVGVVLAARRERLRLALLAAVPLVYLAFMSGQQLFFARFAIPLLPFLAMLAGYAVHQLGCLAKQSSWSTVLSLAVAAAAVAQPLALSAQHDDLCGREDTRALAVAWIEANVPSSATVAVESYSQLNSPFGWKSRQLRGTSVYWPEKDVDATEVLSGRFDYVITTSFGYESWWASDHPPSIYKSLEDRGRLVAVFAPGPGGTDVGYSLDDGYTPFWYLAERERPGPTVKIYEMRQP